MTHCWLSEFFGLARLREFIGQHSKDEQLIKKEGCKFTKLSWIGSRQGDLYCGHMPDGLGYLVYNQEGNRLMATMSMEEACGLVKSDFDMDKLSPDELTTLIQDWYWYWCCLFF